MARACFVTATDTGVGKTVLAATITAGLLAQGLAVAARKPVVTGIASADRHVDGTDLAGLDDHELLAALTGEEPDQVALARYQPAVSPHLAAELAGVPLEPAAIVDALRATAAQSDALIVEGIGGLLVPLSPGWDVRRLASELDWPLVIAARPGLGTINHTLLTIEAARSAGLDVRSVVLTPWPDRPQTLELSNRATIEQLGAVEVALLPTLRAITPAELGRAATGIGYERWLSR
jgi:dethiobiotin synthetase